MMIIVDLILLHLNASLGRCGGEQLNWRQFGQIEQFNRSPSVTLVSNQNQTSLLQSSLTFEYQDFEFEFSYFSCVTVKLNSPVHQFSFQFHISLLNLLQNIRIFSFLYPFYTLSLCVCLFRLNNEIKVHQGREYQNTPFCVHLHFHNQVVFVCFTFFLCV